MTEERAVTRRGALKAIGVATAAGAGTVGVSTAQQEQPSTGLGAREATVFIEAVGTYDFPDYGTFEMSSAGTGFLLSSSGVAVTANHVVTGAATLEAYVGTDTQESYNARVLGVSECSDLAVVQLSGDGFPSLSFRTDPVSAGTEVLAHGFPLGSERIATTDGIVSRTDVDGETNWASVDSVLEHTARITFGHSGGPLVDANGQVVGINYAGIEATDQNYAIGSDLATGMVETMRQGQNIEYIGVNGVAIETATPLTPDGSNRAIHVVSVETGSPAFNTGLRAGDRILRIENAQAVRPGTPFPTKEFYCDVLRTQGSTSPITVQVLRQVPNQNTGGILMEGVINGQPLEAVEVVQPAAQSYDSYQQITDDSGVIGVSVPTAWNDVRGVPAEIGPQLVASPDVNGYINTWDVPGVFVAVTDQVGTDVEGVLDAIALTGCETASRNSFTNSQLTGQLDRFNGCGPGTTSAVNFAGVPEDGSYLVFGNVQLVSERDEEALSRILDTVSVQNFTGTDGGGGNGDGEDGDGEDGNDDGDEGDGQEGDGGGTDVAAVLDPADLRSDPNEV